MIRSPEKILADLAFLKEQGIQSIFLFQDIRMGGKKYVRNFISNFQKEKLDFELLSLELFSPADNDFIQKIKRIGVPIVLEIAPEAGNNDVRKVSGRQYSNPDLFTTLKLTRRAEIPISVFFLLGLGKETNSTINETLNICERIFRFDREVRAKDDHTQGPKWIKPMLGPMIVLDPGSLAYDFPEKYGYKSVPKNFVEFFNKFHKPSWNYWINYETQTFSRENLTKIILK